MVLYKSVCDYAEDVLGKLPRNFKDLLKNADIPAIKPFQPIVFGTRLVWIGKPTLQNQKIVDRFSISCFCEQSAKKCHWICLGCYKFINTTVNGILVCECGGFDPANCEFPCQSPSCLTNAFFGQTNVENPDFVPSDDDQI
uniref:Uncharacterized protein n=1 Tax=Panagrolaimus sp. JU765 TaxID=591449 RepID=A0AC34RK50_9BILA